MDNLCATALGLSTTLAITHPQSSNPNMLQIASSSATYVTIILLAIQARGPIIRNLPGIPNLLAFCWQLVVSVAVLALAGGVATSLPDGGFNWIFYAATIIIFIIYCHKYNKNLSYRPPFNSLTSQLSCFCFLVLIFITSLTASGIRLPYSGLADGPYVWKDWRFPVQQQALALNAPADNSLPSVVADFILHGTSFSEVRPVMPGQEVSNRPFLASLVIMPLHEIGRILSNIQIGTQIPSFNYVGSTWPDTFARISNDQFKLDFGGLYALNFLPIFPCLSLIELILISNFDSNHVDYQSTHNRDRLKFYLMASLLICISPLNVFSVIFTWPKMLAIFFALTSMNTVIYTSHRKKLIAASGVGLSLSYLSHPMTIIMGPILAGVLMLIDAKFVRASSSKRVRTILSLLVNPVLIILPIVITLLLWKIWYTRAGIPAPDLFAQNFSQGALSNYESVIARITSLGDLFSITPVLSATALSVLRTLGLRSHEANPQEQIIFARFLTTSFSIPFLLIAPLSAFSYGTVLNSSGLLNRAKIAIFAVSSCLAIALAYTFARGGIILWHGYLCALLPFAAYFLACEWLQAKRDDNFLFFNGIAYGFIALNLVFFRYWTAIT